jgi:hypothetical protein
MNWNDLGNYQHKCIVIIYQLILMTEATTEGNASELPRNRSEMTWIDLV